jgi:hypothetical protein
MNSEQLYSVSIQKRIYDRNTAILAKVVKHSKRVSPTWDFCDPFGEAFINGVIILPIVSMAGVEMETGFLD